MADPKSIWDLKLHEEMKLSVDGYYYAFRVPGGWIYTGCDTAGTNKINVFVPFSYDLRPEEKE